MTDTDQTADGTAADGTTADSATDTERNTASTETTHPLAVDPTSEVSVPAGSETFDCPHCGRVFPRARQRDLHRGQDHPDSLDDAEVAAYREAAESEWAALRRYRYVALGALVVLYFGFLIAFAVFG